MPGDGKDSFYILSDFFLVKHRKSQLLLKLQKSEVFMAFPPFPIDSFVVKPLIDHIGCRIENVCVESIPEINYLDLVKMGESYKLAGIGRINRSHESYLDYLPNDTCVATADITVDVTRRPLSLTQLVLSGPNEEWHCFGSRK